MRGAEDARGLSFGQAGPPQRYTNHLDDHAEPSKELRTRRVAQVQCRRKQTTEKEDYAFCNEISATCGEDVCHRADDEDARFEQE